MPAPSREVEYWDRFDGGLNLTEQTQSLARNESPDCLNIDFGLRGGISLRGGFSTVEDNADLDGARFLGVGWAGAEYLFIQGGTGSDLYEWDGSTLTDTTHDLSDDDTVRVRMASMRDTPGGTGQVYFANGRLSSNIVMRSWDGTTFQTLGTAWDNNYAAPSGANMPLARFIAEWNSYMWVADTVESSVRYPSRVRFSHLGRPESWAEDDWFDVGDTSEVDPITSIQPFKDSLLVFKKSGVWAVYGNDRDDFVVQQIVNNSGICTCGAMAVNGGVCYWFSTDGKLMAWNGRGVDYLSKNIDYWSDIGKIKHGGSHRLMWHDGRLWMSLEAGSGEAVDRWLFIWNPTLKAFTRYDREVRDLFSWTKIGSDGDPLFLQVDDTEMYRFDFEAKVDTFTAGTVPIQGRFRTAWLRAGETATKKRWKRPRVTAAASSDATMTVRVYTDFDDRDYTRQQEFLISTTASATLWNSFNWGAANWYESPDEYYEFARIPSSGSAYAISYEFTSFDNLGRWWVDSIAVPFRRKQVR